MEEVFIKVSIGELLDKLSILEIKKTKIKDYSKLSHIVHEYENLLPSCSVFLNIFEIKNHYDELLNTNITLWDIEDLIRIKENKKEFDLEFIDLARQVYITNDKRYEIKNKINQKTNSEIQEQKSYNYE
jgi:hypothetical protein